MEENFNCFCCFPIETESGLRNEAGLGLHEPLVVEGRGDSELALRPLSWVNI